MLTATYHMLRDGTFYQDLGADYFTRRDQERTTRRLVQKLTNLGFQVTLNRAA